MTEAEGRVVDLAALAREGEGQRILWTRRTEDLNLNLLAIGRNESIAEHINSEADVLVVGVVGEGYVTVDGRPHRVGAGQAIVIPKGTSRSIRCEGVRFTYLACHRRRIGLWPQGVPRRDPGPSGSGPEPETR